MQNEFFDKAAKGADKAISFLVNIKKTHPKIASECALLPYDLARLHNDAKSAFEVLPNRTTIGVFGASQAGKSYLVSNIAAAQGQMKTQWDGLDVDFLSHINPRGADKEATGIVTRFTHKKDSGIKGFPVEIRVLSEVEIVMILVNSFYKDFNFEGPLTKIVNEQFSKESQDEHFRQFDSFKDQDLKDNFTSFDDLVALYDYVSKVASAPLATFKIQDPFWQRLFNKALVLPLEARAQLYSILWGKLEVLTRAFIKIAGELLKLKGAKKVYAKTDVYFSLKNNEIIQYSDNINSVTCLDKIFSNNLREIEVAISQDDNDLAKVQVPLFAAAVLEVLFPLYGETPLEDFDVLDFPGARSRQPYTYFDIKNKEDEIKNDFMPDYLVEVGGQLIRRGKVAYLFERYNSRHEIDVMLFCLNSSAQSEVSSLTTIITDWIYTNIGINAHERTLFGKNPLVGVLTRFDEAFTKNIEAKAKVEGDIGIIATAIERINGTEWLNAWSESDSGKLIPLNQFFFVRRPNLPNSQKIFKMVNDREVAVLDSMQGKIDDFCQQVRSESRFNDLVYGGKIFGDKTLNAVFTPDDGGALYINKFLLERYRDFRDIKNHFVESIKHRAQNILKTLERYASLEAQKAAQEALYKALNIIENLKQCDDIAKFFSDLHLLQELSFSELSENYTKNYSQSLSNADRFAQEAINRYKATLDDMCNGAAFEQLFGILAMSWTKREILAASSLEDGQKRYSFFYDQDKKSFIEDKEVLRKRFYALMQSYTDELYKALIAMHMSDYLVDFLNEDESKGLTIEYLASKQTRKILRTFSDFCTYLRINYKENKGQNGREYFKENFVLDGNLPSLSSEHMRLGEHYRDDYFSVLKELICGINLTCENQYGLSDTENKQLLEILEDLSSILSN